MEQVVQAKAFLFDLDGVLTPTAVLHQAAWAKVIGEYFELHDAESYTDEDYFNFLDGKPRFAGVQSVLASRGLKPSWGQPDDSETSDTICGVGNRKNAEFLRLLNAGQMHVYPASKMFLDWAKAQRKKLAVVSSSKNARQVLESVGIMHEFEVIVDGTTVEEEGIPGKPDPAMYVLAAERLGVTAAESVVFEDAESGVKAGYDGHFGFVVGVDRGSGKKRLLEAGADRVVTELDELIPKDRSAEHFRKPNEYLDHHRFPVDAWGLVETAFDGSDIGVTESIFAVSNGYLGLRGNYEEGRISHLHGTFINGFHEVWDIQHAEDAFGLAQVGQAIVNVPDVKSIRLYVDDEPLLLEQNDIEHYERRLDFRTGVLTRDVIWRTDGGKRVKVVSKRMVSFTERHLALMQMEVTMLDGDAELIFSCQVQNRQDGQGVYGSSDTALGGGFDPRTSHEFTERVFQPQQYWQKDDRTVMSYQVSMSGNTMAVAVDHDIDTTNQWTVSRSIDRDFAKQVYRVRAKQGVPVTVMKNASYHTSKGVRCAELIDRCSRTLDRVQTDGVDVQYARQREFLDDYWARSDVHIQGQPEVQQAVRWNLFQLAQASVRAENWGIPAKGLTGAGYGGHYFWDTEVYVLPFWTYTNPLVTRNALRFRYNMLPMARQRAAEVNEHGALYPWRTINGHEASAYYAAGTAQYHIDADITYAVAKYVTATGDLDFLIREGIDIVVETARMWRQLGFWRRNGDRKFHIYGVTGPDEYTTVVNDNLYTNVMARHNLEYAVQSLELIEQHDRKNYEHIIARLDIQEEEKVAWAESAAAMAIPFVEHLGIHPQDSQFLEREVWDLQNTPESKRPLLLYYHPLTIYRFQVLKQADVVLALFLQGDHFTDEQKRANFEYYDPITTGDSSLSSVVQAIIAAEVGYADLALHYFHEALFVDLADLHRNTQDGVHIASTGGVWSALVNGFGGMRDFQGKISFDPRLPDSWKKLSFQISKRGVRAQFNISRHQLVAEIIDEPVAGHEPMFEFFVRNESFILSRGTPQVVVQLDGQGPHIPGAPGLSQHAEYRREDGSLITAALPTVLVDELAEAAEFLEQHEG